MEKNINIDININETAKKLAEIHKFINGRS